MASFKIAFVGAGSTIFTRGLMRDLLSVPEFRQIEVAFTDIDEFHLSMAARLCRQDIRANGLDVKITATTDRREALRDAKYVFVVVRVGGNEALRPDIEIPLKYGVDQCVGDTLCAGGISYGQRGIPVLLDICRDIREVAAPDCLLLNYANPMAMMTWAAEAYGGVRTVGLCHGVQNSTHQIADALGFKSMREIEVLAAGINHQTWFLQVRHEGEDLTGRLLEAFERHPRYGKEEKVRIDMLRRFGYYSTESNGHLSEYVPWYRKRPDDTANWIDPDIWIHGETAGYLRISIEDHAWYEANLPHAEDEPALEYGADKRSIEHGSYIIEGLETGRLYRGHFNRKNNGIISNLPADAVIEAPGYVDRNGIHMPLVGDLPLGCAAVCNASVSVQRLAVEAAVHGDDRLLRQAMMMDPLVGAVLNPPEIWQMTDELLVAQEKWLPQYGSAIAAAKARLADGLKVPVRHYEGASRRRILTVEELRPHKEREKREAEQRKAARQAAE